MKMDAMGREALLNGGRVTNVYYHEGSPGGHNNDCVILTMERGDKIHFNSYAMVGMIVTHTPRKKDN